MNSSPVARKLTMDFAFLSDCEAPDPVHPVVYSPVPPGIASERSFWCYEPVLTHKNIDFLLDIRHF